MVEQVITEFNFIAIEKVGPQNNRAEVGVFNCQKLGNHICYTDQHARKIKMGLKPQEVKMFNRLQYLKQELGIKWIQRETTLPFLLMLLVFVCVPFPLLKSILILLHYKPLKYF